MKKSLIALLLVVALVVTVSVFAASAESTNPFEGKTEVVTAYCQACKTTADWYPVDKTEFEGTTKIQEWANTTENSATHFYFPATMKCGTSYTLTSEKYCFDLNGQVVNRKNATLFTLNGTAAETAPVLSLMDSSKDETGKLNTTLSSGKGLFQLTGHGHINIYSGTYEGPGGETTGVSTSSGCGMNIVNSAVGTVNMYGGKLIAGSEYSGGVVLLSGDVTFTVDGGTISGRAGGPNTNSGGVIRLNYAKAKLYLRSGTIEGKQYKSSSISSAVFMDAGYFEMTGGTLKGTSKGGGALYMNNSTTAKITGGTVTGSCASAYSGGSIRGDDSSSLEIGGDALITGGSVTKANGGNIYWTSTGTLTMTGGTITKGVAVRPADATDNGRAGNVYITKGTFNMTGGTISGGLDTDNAYAGGNIYATSAATVNITGGTITGGKATYAGGNLYSGSSKITIDAAEGKTVEISNGTAEKGTNIYISDINTYDTSYTNITGPDVTLVGNMEIAGEDANTCLVTLKDVALAEQLLVSDYAELQLDGATKLSNASIGNGKLTLKEGFNGELTVGWQDATVANTLTYGAKTPASLWQEAGYVGTGTIKTMASDGTALTIVDIGDAAEDDNKLVVAIASGFSVDDEGNVVETPLGTMPTEDDAYGFVRPYGNGTITLAADTTIDLNNGQYHFITGGHQLSVVEMCNDEFAATEGFFTVDRAQTLSRSTVNTIYGTQYVVVPAGETDEGTPKYNAHRVQVEIDSVSIRPSCAGLYYNVNIQADAAVAPYLSAYGIALDIVKMPLEDFKSNGTSVYTEETYTATTGEGVKLENVRSCLLTGILPTITVNGIDSGEVPINANAFITLTGLATDGSDLVVMADNPVNYSLRDIMELVDADETLATNAAVIEMYKTFADPMAKWGLDNINAAANAAA